MQGTYGEEIDGKWRGCAVGCSIRSLNLINGTDIHTKDHYALANVLGITQQLHYLEDKIFEGLPKEKAMRWPLRFTEAIPEEANVSLVVSKFMVWLGEEMKELVNNFDVHRVWDTVISLYQRVIDGQEVTQKEWLWTAKEAAWAEEEQFYEKMADKLIELLEECKNS